MTKTKWEYLRLSNVPSASIVSGKDFLSIAPASKVDLQWLSQSYPSIKMEGPNPSDEVLKIYPKTGESLKVYWSIIDYLGSEGWEPFSVDQDTTVRATTMHFKRSSQLE
jgi:hypothetical protein